ncbi:MULTISPECIES: D-alanyl-D-alanine carboxypeptidase [unclassified Coleofasciculus]|uniref:D-alanyl-D-alanine carboxypeptidase n=1 Tax=unclassified Coleofasciculus TaxID=2692782 RepID=UPI00187F046D|nr:MULTISPECIES: D-alanyl-D-alanine carboxypeptidase [unclassified Coleofasciculus]MBE9126322.1 D-alanyl-D-alanine carboxypeptidase [Coleofasciculus sp. LEGE 07081]MBE9147501.1 D-alanyl-D-alanine carboxypeptidase [Coleofasciculus sp. LEGE 07092]
MLQRIGAGLIASSLAALLVKMAGTPATPLGTAQMLTWQDMPLFTWSKLDPAAEAVVRQYLKTWKDKGGQNAYQGIWMESEQNILADHQGNIPLPAASLTKIATTLASLKKWEPSHQFETLVSTTGSIKNGVLQGDLVVTGSSDPLFVWEEAIAIGNSLNQLGIRRVTGSLVIVGDFYMNFEEDPIIAGKLLHQALNASRWSPQAATQHRAMPPRTPKPQVAIAGQVKVPTTAPANTTLLLRHQSLPLAQILWHMNVYSNNPMAEMLAKSVGGAGVVAKQAAESADVPQNEIQLINGSGLGVENRISPRAVTAMLMAIERVLEPHQMGVEDVFPQSGRDRHGTLFARKIPLGTAIKTGTLRQVSALAGVMPTSDRGRVWFAIINGGSSNIWEFREQQDQILEQLSQKWGNSAVLNVNTAQSPPLLGDPKRIQKVMSN